MQSGNKKAGDSPVWLTALGAFLLAAIVAVSLTRQDAHPIKYFAGIMQE